MTKKLSGYYLLKEPRWAFDGGAELNPTAEKGTLLSYGGTLEYDGAWSAPFSEHKPNKGDHLFFVKSEEPWGFEIALGEDEIERYVEPVEIVDIRWVRDVGNQNITISHGFRGKEKRFTTQKDLAKRLNQILKSRGVLLDGALIWCLDLPWKTSSAKFYPAGSKLENYE